MSEVEQDDEDLLSRLIEGDETAFEIVSRRYYAMIYRVAWRVLGDSAEAEDVAQEAFLKLWRAPQQIHTGAALKSWLARVAHNLAIDNRRRRRPDLPGELPEMTDGTTPVDHGLVSDQAADVVDRAIADLPERQRMALVLTYFEGLGNRETADALGVSVEAVESLLSRARRGLKKNLRDDWQDLIDDLAAPSAQ